MEQLQSAFEVIQSTLNRLLPFTTPETPLIQDIIHTLLLCAILYFAPRILEREVERQTQIKVPAAPQDGRTEVTENEVIDAEQPGADGDNFEAEAEWPEDLEDRDEVDGQNDDDPLQFNENNDNEGEAGPADPLARVNPPPQPPRMNTRVKNVGKKKAKALARKEQNRAYHEFMRQQGEAQRAKDREAEAAMEAELFEEKRRRALLEQDLEEKRRLEREAKREEERRNWEEEIGRRKKAVTIVRESLQDEAGFVRIADVVKAVGGNVDEKWVEQLIRAEGILSKLNPTATNDDLTIMTGGGYVVRVSSKDMQEAYQRAYVTSAIQSDAKISFNSMAKMLEDVIRRRKDVLTGKAGSWDWEKEQQKIAS